MIWIMRMWGIIYNNTEKKWNCFSRSLLTNTQEKTIETVICVHLSHMINWKHGAKAELAFGRNSNEKPHHTQHTATTCQQNLANIVLVLYSQALLPKPTILLYWKIWCRFAYGNSFCMTHFIHVVQSNDKNINGTQLTAACQANKKQTRIYAKQRTNTDSDRKSSRFQWVRVPNNSNQFTQSAISQKLLCEKKKTQKNWRQPKKNDKTGKKAINGNKMNKSHDYIFSRFANKIVLLFCDG